MFDNIMAVEEGFEPSVHLLHTVLAGQPFKPLKHSTIGVAHGWLVRGLE